jgi:hypothetical protein
MNQWRRSFAQGNNRCTARDRKKIKPTPDGVIAALRNHLKIGVCEMANFDPYFQNAMANTALENGWRLSFIAASRAAQRANNPHNLSQAIRPNTLLLHSNLSSYDVLRSISLRDFSSSLSRSPTSKPTVRAPSSVAMQIMTKSSASFGGGSSGWSYRW